MTQNFNEELEILQKELLKSKSFEEKLTIWADYTVNYCHNIAAKKEIDRSFYAF